MRLTRPDGGRDTVIVFSGRPRAARHADPARPDGRRRGRLRRRASRRTAAASTRRPRSAIDMLAEVVNDVVRKKGVLLIPSFAIGRTQDIVWELDRLLERWADPAAAAVPRLADGQGRLRHLPAPIPRRTTRRPPRSSRAQRGAARLPRPAGRPERRRVAAGSRAPQPPYIIVASNGMLTGGRSVGPCRAPAGRSVGDGAVRRLPGRGHARRPPRPRRGQRADLGHQIPVRATVRSLDGFSAHADEPELLDWLGNFVRGRRPGDPGVPRDVYLVHGDPPAQAALLPKVEGLGFRTTVPAWLQTVSLD